MADRPQAASPVNNPSSNQPNLQKTPQSLPRRRVRHRRHDMQRRRDTTDRDRRKNIVKSRGRFRHQRWAGYRLNLSLAQNLTCTVAVILLLAWLHRLLATGLPVRQETGNQRPLAATSPQGEHGHSYHRGEAGRIWGRDFQGVSYQFRPIRQGDCSKFIPKSLPIPAPSPAKTRVILRNRPCFAIQCFGKDASSRP